jgi:hypothetical protein
VNFFSAILQGMETKQIIEQSGGVDAVAARVGVKAASIRPMLYKAQLPASWYFALCDMTGQTLPRQLFSFKGLSH